MIICPGLTLPRVSLALLHQSLIKKKYIYIPETCPWAHLTEAFFIFSQLRSFFPEDPSFWQGFYLFVYLKQNKAKQKALTSINSNSTVDQSNKWQFKQMFTVYRNTDSLSWHYKLKKYPVKSTNSFSKFRNSEKLEKRDQCQIRVNHGTFAQNFSKCSLLSCCN